MITGTSGRSARMFGSMSSPLIPGMLMSERISTSARARQRDNEFGEIPRLGIDVDLAAMLFHDDVVAHGKPEPRALACRLGGEEGIEHLLLHLRGNAGAVVADADFHAAAEILRGRAQCRLKAVAGRLLALGRGIESVGDQIEEDAGDFLRID